MSITGKITSLSRGYFLDDQYVNDGKVYLEIQLEENPGAVLGKTATVTITIDEEARP